MEVLRECKCGEMATTKKELHKFTDSKTCKYGKSNECKKCLEVRKKIDRQKRQRRYQWEAVQMLGGKCEACNKEATLDTMICFDFHHRDPILKVEAISQLIGKKRPIKVVLEEAEKCILFCACCHRLHHQKYDY